MILVISTTWKTVIMLIAMIAVFYFFLIRPQSQQAKKEKDYRAGLQKGDRVMTAGGIHASIVSNEGEMATIEVAPQVRIRVQTATLQPIPTQKEK